MIGGAPHRRCMSDSRGRAMSVTLLMLMSIFTALLTTTSATVISTNTTWSGEVSIDDNIQIMSGKTLTIEEGTNITVTGDYIITVDGSVVIDGLQSKPVTITNNNNPGGLNSNTGWWDGFLVTATGNIDASWLEISRGRRSFEVAGSVTLDNVTVDNSFFGADVSGSASVTDFNCQNIDFTCLSVLSGATVSANTVSVSGSSYGVENGGSLTLDGLQVSQSGFAVVIYDGASGSGQNIGIDNSTIAVTSRDATSFTIDSMQVDDTGLLLDSIGSDGLQISDVTGSGIDRLIVGTNMADVTLDNIVVSGSGASGWMVAAENSGTLMLRNSTLTGFDAGLRMTGSGTHVLESTSISASGTTFDISGLGRLESYSSLFSTTTELGYLSGIDSQWITSSLSGDSSSNGLELIDGKHTFVSSSISRSYLYADSSSVGLGVTWGDVEANGLTLTGWSDGIQCRTECLIDGSSLTAELGGVQAGNGISIDGGAVTLDSLTTGSALHGVHVAQGELHLSDWTASSHGGSTLLVDSGQTAVVRNLPASSSNSPWDAEGDGSLLFGGASARVNTADYEEFTESTISVTDLSSIAVSGVNVMVHGFSEVTDTNGEVDLPLLVAGSNVSADDGTYGVSDVISPPGGTLQLPVIPSTGPWVIPMGVHAVLIGNNYTAPAGDDVTISTAASLTLKNAHLSVPSGDIIVEGSGKLIGNNGSTDAVVRTTGAHAIEGIGAGLTVQNDFHHGCSWVEHVWSGLNVEGDFYLEQSCSLNIYDGSVLGTIHPSMGGYFSLSNSAIIRVVDFGEPVVGATVTVQGNQVTTNQEGMASFSATYRNVTEVSDSNSGLLQVYILRNGHSQIRNWDSTEPANIDVMMSTVNGGYLAEWLRLDAAFSPYYLDDNLTITTGTTLTIQAFSSLSVKADRGIAVSGVLEASQASIGGNDWNGVTLLEGGMVDLLDGQMMGGSLSVGTSSSAILDGMIVSNNPLLVSGTGDLQVKDSLLHLADNCIYANSGVISVSGTTIQDCSQSAVLLTQSVVDFNNVTIGSGNEQGLHLRGSTGSVMDIEGGQHDGVGPAVHLEMVDSGLVLSNMNLSAGDGSPAVAVEWSDMVVMSDSEIYGSPGMVLDHSTASISSVNFHGDSVGVALDIEGGRADASQFSNCNFENYGTAVHLIGDEGDLEMPSPRFNGNQFQVTTAYFADGLSFISESETIQGSIEAFGTKTFVAEIWNPISFESSNINVSGAASIVAGSTWNIQAVGDAGAILSDATIQVTVSSFDGVVEEQMVTTDTSGGSASISIIYQAWSESGSSVASVASWSASAPSYIETQGSWVPSESSSRNIVAQLTKNQDPTVSINLPFPDAEVQEGQSVNFSATGFDADATQGAELSYVWYIRAQGENSPGEQIFTGSSGMLDYIGEVGVYIVTVIVADSWGGSAYDALTITVILDDADNDFISTCAINGPNAWYDLEEDRPCGPDIYDDDDDNDRISDSRDVFPFDPCAHSDHDLDGLPNSLLPNCETDLIEDDDDDNDGTLDNVDPDPMDATVSGSDESSSSSSVFSPSVIIPILLIIIVIVAIFLRSSRNEFGEVE